MAKTLLTTPRVGALLCCLGALGAGCADVEAPVEALDAPEVEAATLAPEGLKPPTPLPAYRYEVRADGCQVDLGAWSKAEGLGVDLLPPFAPLELSRAASADTLKVKAWLNSLASLPPQSHDLTVSLFSTSAGPLSTWHLQNVLPTHWTVAPINASSSSVIVETLIVSHGVMTGGPACPAPVGG